MSYPMPPAPPNYRRVNHFLHLVLTVITAGGWALFVWPWWAMFVAARNSSARSRYEHAQTAYDNAVREYNQRAAGPRHP